MTEALSAPHSGCLNYTFAVKPESLSSELAEISTKFALSFPHECVEPTQTNGTPSLYLFAMYEGKLTARCSIWTETKVLFPPSADQLELRVAGSDVKLGFIGHYAATSLKAGLELLELADFELKKRGCNVAIGPIDGSTWRRYRLISESCGERIFSLEPVNPLSWNKHFTDAGYQVVKTYESSINRELDLRDPDSKSLKAKLQRQGVKLRSLNAKNIDEDLEGIFRVTMEAMQNNFLFSPIDRASFLKEQTRLTSLADPELVVVAEKAGNIVGYLFAYPDQNSAAFQPRLVMKTIARTQDEKLKGLGRLLYQEVHSRAYEKGFREAVHALYAKGNKANAISSMYGEAIRSYALYGKAL
jgi:L-amino acid N-acyltransferase YncA